ncbi:Uncharacterised protein [Citrobacter freundii]|nr:Uncharacterised protein [Citrobacter freundii]
MKRKIMVVTAAYGYDQVRAAGGQAAMLPIIAEAGADGVEIRRELLTDAELKALPLQSNSSACWPVIQRLSRYSLRTGTLIPDFQCSSKKRRLYRRCG